MFNLEPLTNKITEFTFKQNNQQEQIIALLKALSQQLSQIENKLNK